jgi:hypothetical protein
MTLAPLVTDSSVGHVVECGLIQREAVEVNDRAMNITELNIVNRSTVEDSGSLWNGISVTGRAIKPHPMNVKFLAFHVAFNIHRPWRSSGDFRHGQLFST